MTRRLFFRIALPTALALIIVLNPLFSVAGLVFEGSKRSTPPARNPKNDVAAREVADAAEDAKEAPEELPETSAAGFLGSDEDGAPTRDSVERARDRVQSTYTERGKAPAKPATRPPGRKMASSAAAAKPVAQPSPKSAGASTAPQARDNPNLKNIEQVPSQEPADDMETEVVGGRTGKGAKNSVHSAVEAEPADDTPNAAFSYTHLLPSPNTIPGGSWVVGSSIAYGVSDYLQLSTDFIRDVYGYWNVSAKAPLIEYPTFVASAFVSWDSFNLRNAGDSNPDQRVTSLQPGLVTGFEIMPDMAFFVGGNAFIHSGEIPDGQTSGFSKGAQIEGDWSWLYNRHGSKLAGNAVSLGANYDFTYKLVGVGITHHWPTFTLGIHYTVNADVERVMPLIAFATNFTF